MKYPVLPPHQVSLGSKVDDTVSTLMACVRCHVEKKAKIFTHPPYKRGLSFGDFVVSVDANSAAFTEIPSPIA